MGFSVKQLQALRWNLAGRHIRTREANGRELSYIEGWYAISEANRIFGFDAWCRETWKRVASWHGKIVDHLLWSMLPKYGSRCKQEGTTVIREGHGSGEGRGSSPGEVHDMALKAAETDATKRRLQRSENAFGLALYRKEKKPTLQRPTAVQPASASPPIQPRLGSHPDDTTPIPRPSHYYGRR